MRVLKFGGTSVATAERRAIVADLVARALVRHGRPLTVVTSALAEVTDLLSLAIERATRDRASWRESLAELVSRHTDPSLQPSEQTANALLLAELGESLHGVALLGECPLAVRHRILATGERLALPLVAAALRREGLAVRCFDGGELLATAPADSGLEPRVDGAASRRRLEARWSTPESEPGDGPSEPSSGQVTLVTGFVAADGQGRTTTLGRGASDLTATLLAELLGAEAVEIWSDVDGVLDAPPCHVPGARPLDWLGYGAASDLARFGAKVLHPETLAPARRAGIPVFIRNTLRPEVPGTRIDAGPKGRQGAMAESVVAVTALEGVTLLELGRDERRSARRGSRGELFGSQEIQPLLWAGGLDPDMLRPVVRSHQADHLVRQARRRGRMIRRQDDLALVAVVATGHPARVSLASTLLVTLEENGITPRALALTESCDDDRHQALAVVVSSPDTARAVEGLYRTLARQIPWSQNVAVPTAVGVQAGSAAGCV